MHLNKSVSVSCIVWYILKFSNNKQIVSILKFFLAAVIFFFILDKSMSDDKNIPNPYGRKGGLEHRAKVKEVTEGYGIKPEFHSYNRKD